MGSEPYKFSRSSLMDTCLGISFSTSGRGFTLSGIPIISLQSGLTFPWLVGRCSGIAEVVLNAVNPRSIGVMIFGCISTYLCSIPGGGPFFTYKFFFSSCHAALLCKTILDCMCAYQLAILVSVLEFVGPMKKKKRCQIMLHINTQIKGSGRHGSTSSRTHASTHATRARAHTHTHTVAEGVCSCL